MKTFLVLTATAALAASAAAQSIQQPTLPPRNPLGLTPAGGQRLHDPNAEQEARQMPTPGGPQDRRRPAPAAHASDADGASVDAIIAALYASVSHDAAGEPNWDRMRSMFLQVGMLIPPKNPRSELFTVLDVDGFEQRVKEGMAAAKAKGEPTSFFEREVARRADCFGTVCQVFSTYESRRAPSDEKPFVRGINSIQLLNDGHRWWIASVAWDTERADNPIPPQYLPNAPAAAAPAAIPTPGSIPPEYRKKTPGATR
jgi:hypothetical protein